MVMMRVSLVVFTSLDVAKFVIFADKVVRLGQHLSVQIWLRSMLNREHVALLRRSHDILDLLEVQNRRFFL